MEFLIHSAWIREEAAARNVEIAPTERQRAVADAWRELRSQGGSHQELANRGMTRSDFELRVQFDQLRRKVQRVVIGAPAPPSRSEIVARYRRHREMYRRPATRRIQVVITRAQSQARRARLALAEGQKWPEVVKRHSIDPSRRVAGWMWVGGDNAIPTLRKAVFGAPAGRAMGPRRIRDHWWVFRVRPTVPGRQLALGEVTSRIRAEITGLRSARYLERFVGYLERRYRSRTRCMEALSVQQCGGRPL